MKLILRLGVWAAVVMLGGCCGRPEQREAPPPTQTPPITATQVEDPLPCATDDESEEGGECIRFPINTGRHFFFPPTTSTAIGELVTSGEVYAGWKVGQHWNLGTNPFATTSFRAMGHLTADPQDPPDPTFDAPEGFSYAVKPFLPTTHTTFSNPTHILRVKHTGDTAYTDCGYFRFESTKLTTYARTTCLSTTANCSTNHVANSFCRKDEILFEVLPTGLTVVLSPAGAWKRSLEAVLPP